MVTIYHRRATPDEPDVTILKVPRGDGRMLAEVVAEKFEPSSTVITDEHQAYKSLWEIGYVHPAVTMARANTHQVSTTKSTPTTASAG